MTDDTLERCPHCDGHGHRDVERAHDVLRRTCRECSGSGRVLPEGLVLDYCGGREGGCPLPTGGRKWT